MSPSDKPAPIWLRGLQVLAGLWTACMSFLLLVLSASGPFRVESPWGRISCTHPDRVLLQAFLGLVAWQGILALRRRWTGEPLPAPLQPDLRPAERIGLPLFLGVAVVLLWVRRLYKSYVRVLFKMGSHPAYPFWQIHLMHAALLPACLHGWYAIRRTHGAFAAFVAAMLMALSSIFFSPSQGDAISGAVVLVAWVLLSTLAARGALRGWRWGVAAALAVVAAAATRALYPEHLGWAGNRVGIMFCEHASPGSARWLALAGLVGCIAKREMPAPLSAAAALAVGGLLLAGGRDPVMFWGGWALLPLAATLGGLGAGYAWRNRWVQQSALGRNVVLLLVLSILAGIAREML
jgi:hypothetical protein